MENNGDMIIDVDRYRTPGQPARVEDDPKSEVNEHVAATVETTTSKNHAIRTDLLSLQSRNEPMRKAKAPDSVRLSSDAASSPERGESLAK